MMKTTYQAPETNVLYVSLQQMIAASPLGKPEDGFDKGNAPELDDNQTSGNLGRRRRRSVWDDEDDRADF